MSQQRIHKTDFSDVEFSTVAQIDMLLSDIQQQVNDILPDHTESEIATLIGRLSEYIRGYRDGHRMGKANPFPPKP